MVGQHISQQLYPRSHVLIIINFLDDNLHMTSSLQTNLQNSMKLSLKLILMVIPLIRNNVQTLCRKVRVIELHTFDIEPASTFSEVKKNDYPSR